MWIRDIINSLFIDFFTYLLSTDTGIVGIACVLNLISGGWRLNDIVIPAQCVLLDYCGCKNHWNKEGVPTEINFNRLKKF